MPYRTDKLKLDDPFLNRRIKLLPCQKEMVLWWYERGLSIRGITKMFKVDRRLIQFIIFPERKEKNIADRKERGGSKIYYNKEKHAQSVREHRNYKHKTLKNL